MLIAIRCLLSCCSVLFAVVCRRCSLLLFVVCCLLFDVRCAFVVIGCCLLPGASWLLCVVRCLWIVACCVLFVPCGLLCLVGCLLSVVPRLLFAVCCLLFGGFARRCLLLVVCC